MFRIVALISCLQLTVREEANLLFSGTEKHQNFHSVSDLYNVVHMIPFLSHSSVKGYMEMGDFAFKIIKI